MNALPERPSPAIKKTGDLRPDGSETCHFHQFWRSARLSPSGNRFRALPTARERPDLGGPYSKRGAIWGIPASTNSATSNDARFGRATFTVPTTGRRSSSASSIATICNGSQRYACGRLPHRRETRFGDSIEEPPRENCAQMSRFSGISVAHRRNVGPEAACAVTARPAMGGFCRREVTGRRIARPYGESWIRPLGGPAAVDGAVAALRLIDRAAAATNHELLTKPITWRG